ncbi:hypothetical protein D3C78_1339580 [compost metagenome]
MAAQVIGYVMGAMFIVLPMLFLAAMGWAGYSVGSGVASALAATGTNDLKAAGSSGGSMLTNIAGKGLKGK